MTLSVTSGTVAGESLSQADTRNSASHNYAIPKPRISLLLDFALAFISILFVIPFIWLMVTIGQHQGQVVNDDVDKVLEQYTRAASTAFTIGFAAILGISVKNYTRWRLERTGMPLGQLEQLMQSRTFFSAITTQITLRRFSITSVTLLILWIFSPLGSQACLRISQQRNVVTTLSSTANFLDTVTWDPFASLSIKGSMVDLVNTIFTGSLFTPAAFLDKPMDMQGNVKIPLFAHGTQQNDTTWYDISSQNLVASNYASLLGLPLANVSRTGNSSMMVETSHIQFECSRPTAYGDNTTINYSYDKGGLIGKPPFENGTFNSIVANEVFYEMALTFVPYVDFTAALDQFIPTGNHDMAQYIPGLNYRRPWSSLVANDYQLPRSTLLFQTFNAPCVSANSTAYQNGTFPGAMKCAVLNDTIGAYLPWWSSRCVPFQVYVQSKIECVGASTTSSIPSNQIQQPQCMVVAQRNSPLSSVASSNLTFLSFTRNYWSIMTSILFATKLSNIPYVDYDATRIVLETYVSYYLENPQSTFLVDRATAIQRTRPPDLGNVSDAELSARLAQLFNTNIQAWYYISAQTSSNLFQYYNTTTQDLMEVPLYNETLASVSQAEVVYDINWGWLVVYVISVVIMFGAGIVNVVCAFKLSMPDVLGYCSALVADSVWFKGIERAGESDGKARQWDGMKRAHMWRDLYVGIGNIVTTRPVLRFLDGTLHGDRGTHSSNTIAKSRLFDMTTEKASDTIRHSKSKHEKSINDHHGFRNTFHNDFTPGLSHLQPLQKETKNDQNLDVSRPSTGVTTITDADNQKVTSVDESFSRSSNGRGNNSDGHHCEDIGTIAFAPVNRLDLKSKQAKTMKRDSGGRWWRRRISENKDSDVIVA